MDCKFQMCSKRLPEMPLWRQGWRSFQGFKENRRQAVYYELQTSADTFNVFCSVLLNAVDSL